MARKRKAYIFIVTLVGVIFSAGMTLAWKDPLPISGLPGQPETRRNLITEYIVIPSLGQEPNTPYQLNKTAFMRVRKRLWLPWVDAVIIHQPGFASGASGLPELAAQIVEMAALKGKIVEVWVVDRRENNLEDIKGMRDALQNRDPYFALQYYFGDGVLDENGKFRLESELGGPGATFIPLKQEDVPFEAEWGIEVYNQDVETLLNLVPEGRRSTNVFLMGHGQGGLFVSEFPGSKLSSGKRGYEELAGLVFLDGGPALGENREPSPRDINDFIMGIQELRDGTSPRFGATFGSVTFDPKYYILDEIMAMLAYFSPREESIFPVPPGANGGPMADLFTANLRLTNRARFGFTWDDDPVPGTFLQELGRSCAGYRIGRIDFTPVPGTENDCAESGPFGLIPPCIPALNRIDSTKVYDWIDGGPDGAGPSGPLNGWIKDSYGYFLNSCAISLEEPSKSLTLSQETYVPPMRTNVIPVTINFPVSGPVLIDSSKTNHWLWYLNNRYDADLLFVRNFMKIQIDRDDVNIHIDIDKESVNIPVINYTGRSGFPYNPFPNVDDYTAINRTQVMQTPLAMELSPIDPEVNIELYHHSDLHGADNSKGPLTVFGQVTPGDNGANVVSTTLVDWIIARIRKGKFRVPYFVTHPLN